MPKYDYMCSRCGHHEEIRHSITENPVISCPDCDKEMRRILGGDAGFLVKGGRNSGDTAGQVKAASDMAHARKVERTIKGKLQPKTRQQPPQSLDSKPGK